MAAPHTLLGKLTALPKPRTWNLKASTSKGKKEKKRKKNRKKKSKRDTKEGEKRKGRKNKEKKGKGGKAPIRISGYATVHNRVPQRRASSARLPRR